MKSKFFSLAVIVLTAFSFCSVQAQELPVIDLPENISMHFLSPEPIQYVDISTKFISGDLPIKNVLRIKRVSDTLSGVKSADALADAVVTVAGESFLAQYKVRYVPVIPGRQYQTQIEILPEHMRPLETGAGLSKLQMEKLASSLLFKRMEKGIASSKAFGIHGNINHLSTLGDYIFVDLGYVNNSNLKFDTDQVRFKIEDQKINKATTVQSIEIKPEFVLFRNPAFRRNYRNVFVFKKFSFPGHKVLKIELNEKQISGRVITLTLKYKDVLEADVL